VKNYGRTSVHDFLGDMVVYRNLVPADPRLPPLAKVRDQVGLPAGVTPRKSEPEYARVLVHLVQEARALDPGPIPIKWLIYVGDTQMNDGTAFANICHTGGWEGLAFIGAEQGDTARVQLIEQDTGTLYLANRWSALADFDAFCRGRGVPMDQSTAVIVDLDKTAIGARGRNDHVIDQARVEAVRRTIGDLLADSFDPHSFEAAYDRLNQTEFHPFTADNQDYLTYVCLILGSGQWKLEPLIADVRAGHMASFEQFIARVDDRATELPSDLRRIHSSVHALVQQGDPTPFKAFRYNEYQSTIGRMGQMDDGLPAEELLQHEIVITQEVQEVALRWRERGALLFGLSDKPDEASVPTDDLAERGFRAIHQVETHAIGG
jgi:hypothetical protein